MSARQCGKGRERLDKVRFTSRSWLVLALLFCSIAFTHGLAIGSGVPEPGTPVTLDQVIERAKQASIVADLARTQLELGQWQAEEMQAPLRPQMTLDAVATQFDQTQYIDPICIDTGDLTLPGGWEIPWDEICIPPEPMEMEVEGKSANATLSVRGALFPTELVRATRTLADLTGKTAEVNYGQAIEDITAQVVELYYGVLQAETAVSLVELAVEEAELELQETQWREEAGSATLVDRLEATAKVMQLQGQLTGARGTLDSLRIRLNQVAGYPLDTQLTLERPREKPPVVPSIERAMEAARAKRPDVRQAEHALAQAVAHETIVRAQGGPTLQLFATVQRPDMEYTAGVDRHGFGQISVEGKRQQANGERIESKDDGWVVGLRGSWAFLDGGSQRAKLEQAAQQVKAATLHRDLIVSGIEADLRRYEAELYGARHALDSTQKALQAMEQAEERMAEMYRRGAVSKGDLLRIRLGRLQADQQMLEAEHKYAKARLDYMRTAGLLFEDWF